jgi:phosphinothricin acetyltransferase
MAGKIRSAIDADAPAIQRIYAPFVTDHVTSFEAVAPDAAQMARRIQEGAGRFPWLVYEHDGIVAGYAYASPHGERAAYQWSANVSVYIAPSAHRRGVGRALYTALLELLRRQRFANAYGGITLPNPASVALHEALGFVPVGIYRGVGFKFGEWRDVMWLHARLRDDPQPAGPPLPVPSMDDPEVRQLFDRCGRMVKGA